MTESEHQLKLINNRKKKNHTNDKHKRLEEAKKKRRRRRETESGIKRRRPLAFPTVCVCCRVQLQPGAFSPFDIIVVS